MNERRYDLDWLRVLAFAVLVFFHAAVTFIPGGLPLIQNEQTSQGLQWFVDYSHQFRLGLLFLVAGAGIGFARRHRSEAEFIRERLLRLGLPLLVGIILIVPPMVFTEKVFLGEFAGSFLTFYPQFFTHGVYPEGNLSWHHFWFIAYLLIYCLAGLRIFKWLDRVEVSGPWIARFNGPGLFGFVLPLIVVEVLLRAAFPGFRDLIHDWASFFHWFLLLLAGYAMAKYPDLLDAAMRLRFYSLGLAMLSTTALFYFFYNGGFDLAPTLPDILRIYVMFCMTRMLMVWSTTLVLVGFAARHLRFAHPWLSYLNQAVYPLFILHLTTLTVLGYFAVQWQAPIWIKYLFMVIGTFALVLGAYHFLIRPFNAARLMFGVKATGE